MPKATRISFDARADFHKDGLAYMEGAFDTGRRALTVGLVLTVTLVGFETLAVSTALPSISRDLDGVALYGWVGSAYMLGNLLGIVYAGRAADRRGPAQPFVTGLALFAIALAVAAVAPTMAVLVGARFVQGLGGGAIPAIAYVAAGRGYPTELQPRVFAIMSSAWVIPGVIAPSIAALITSTAGWRWVFAGLLPFVLPALLLTVRPLRALGPPDPDHGEPTVISTAAAVRVTIGVALVLAAIDGVPLVLAVPLGAIGAVLAVRAFMTLTPPGTLRAAAGLPATIAVRGLQTFAFFGADFFVPRLIHDARGQSNIILGFAVTGGTLAWTIASWINARLMGRYGARPLVVASFGIIAVGNALLILGAIDSSPVAVAVGAATVTGFGMGLGFSAVSVTMLSQATGREGAASAALSLTDVLGFAVGAGIGGAAVSLAHNSGWTAGTGVQLAFALPLAVAVLGVAVARRLPGSGVGVVAALQEDLHAADEPVA
jgi:MFS family permease